MSEAAKDIKAFSFVFCCVASAVTWGMALAHDHYVAAAMIVIVWVVAFIFEPAPKKEQRDG